MKRIGNLNDKIYALSNIKIADNNARQNTKSRFEVYEHDCNKDEENLQLAQALEDGTYRTSKYKIFKIYEPKEREIFKLPYFPDRIAHHAIMNVLKPIWINTFIHQTYSSIEGRGIHILKDELWRTLVNYPEETSYCLKLDIRKFYPSIDHDILKEIISHKIKDQQTINILNEVIDSTDYVTPKVGVPIGNYLSQYFANVYLTEFDHTVKEQWKCKYYFRYADDIVILSNDKRWLHNVLIAIKIYFKHKLKLEVKPNYQVFPVEPRGIDFVGYVFRHDHIRLRKSIKKNLQNLVKKYQNDKITKQKFKKSLAAYKGWLQQCNAIHLAKSIYEKTGVRLFVWDGELTGISKFQGKYIWVVRLYRRRKYFEIDFKYKGKKYKAKSQSWQLYKSIKYRKRPFYFKYDKNKCKRNSSSNLEIGE